MATGRSPSPSQAIPNVTPAKDPAPAMTGSSVRSYAAAASSHSTAGPVIELAGVAEFVEEPPPLEELNVGSGSSPRWHTDAGVDVSSLAGNISDDGRDEYRDMSLPDTSPKGPFAPSEFQSKRSRYFQHGASDEPVFSVVDGLPANSRKVARLDRLDANIQDLPVAEIRFNEEANRMDVTTESTNPQEFPPPFYPHVVDVEEDWSQFYDANKASAASNLAGPTSTPLPSLPVYNTPARLLHDTSIIFDTRNERAVKVQFQKQGTTSGPDSTGDKGNGSNRLGFPTQTDLESLLPHPNAYFLPSLMEWVVVAPSDSFVAGVSPRVESPKPWEHVFDETPLFEMEEVDISPELQAYPIPKGHAPASPDLPPEAYLTTFKGLTSRGGRQDKIVFVSQAKAIPAILDEALLLRLRSTRLSNPPPGVDDTAQYFDGAVRLILRMLAGALNGNTRAVIVESKTVTQKLGWDEIARDIFLRLGWKLEIVAEDDARQAIKPPNLLTADGRSAGPGWPRMGRAWLELYLWAQHCREKMSINEPESETRTDSPFVPVAISAMGSIERIFAFDKTQLDLSLGRNPPSERARLSLEYLGVHAQDADATIKAAYEAATTRDIRLAPRLLSAVEYLLMDQRKESIILPVILTEERSRGQWTFDELENSYALIGIEGTKFDASDEIDITFIAGLYEGKIKQAQQSESVANMENLKRALQVICRSKGDPPELVRLSEAHSGMTLAQAYSRLQAPEPVEDVDDESLSMLYNVRLGDDPARTDEWRQALHTIALARQSGMLLRLSQGQSSSAPDPWASAADPERPAGLNNIGNTCYLNSVLQYFFSIREIRERVLEYSSKVGIWEMPKALRRIGGRQVTAREAERSHKFILHLAALFQNMISFPAAAVTPERELAYLALVSARAEEQDEAMRQLAVEQSTSPKTVPERGSLENSTGSAGTDTTLVEEAAAALPASDGPATAPPLGPPSLPERRVSLMQVGAQQDVSECLDNVMFQLEVALGTLNDESPDGSEAQPKDATPGDVLMEIKVDGGDEAPVAEPSLLSALFLGETAQRLQLLTNINEGIITGSSSEVKKEVFKILLVDVLEEEGRDIYDGLDSFFDEEVIASGESSKAVRRSVTLLRPPPFLQIQLQRVQFDRVRSRAFKSQAHMETHETIYLDRYCDFDPSVPEDAKRLETRKLSQSLRREARELRAKAEFLRSGSKALTSRSQRITETLTDTAAFMEFLRDQRDGTKRVLSDALDSIEFDEALPLELRAHAAAVTEELKKIEEQLRAIKAQTTSLWKDETRYEYVLVSLFMHRGEATHGHYFLNQRKLQSSQSGVDVWFKYNDSMVSTADVKDVLRDPTSANPYLVCYVRKDLQERLHLVETLKREF
ncbi:cysteine proteinase [Tilletiaria anomala UBC 951]|uniref:ubiquitinyl hydrolase 1 n=1 Tax=Tilletiaria anomala (strain ATCC 24038 / CBS 436.72 / UBC 951) TaxID=1037660 RepID=A0A066VYC9_TILAU|nr:cysteine proteinase [Tilletiaria anomala UBC 951]KDN46481.1 cysteine proteinase [Tilletiaria anomala UBC 951]